MAIEMKVPPVGESITEVTIARWNKKEGEHVNADEVLCELESDKATFELTAEKSGILHIVAKEGETIKVGAPICEIEPNGSAKTESKPAKEEVKTSSNGQKASVVEMKIPPVGESINEVTIAKF